MRSGPNSVLLGASFSQDFASLLGVSKLLRAEEVSSRRACCPWRLKGFGSEPLPVVGWQLFVFRAFAGALPPHFCFAEKFGENPQVCSAEQRDLRPSLGQGPQLLRLYCPRFSARFAVLPLSEVAFAERFSSFTRSGQKSAHEWDLLFLLLSAVCIQLVVAPQFPDMKVSQVVSLVVAEAALLEIRVLFF